MGEDLEDRESVEVEGDVADTESEAEAAVQEEAAEEVPLNPFAPVRPSAEPAPEAKPKPKPVPARPNKPRDRTRTKTRRDWGSFWTEVKP